MFAEFSEKPFGGIGRSRARAKQLEQILAIPLHRFRNFRIVETRGKPRREFFRRSVVLQKFRINFAVEQNVCHAEIFDAIADPPTPERPRERIRAVENRAGNASEHVRDIVPELINTALAGCCVFATESTETSSIPRAPAGNSASIFLKSPKTGSPG